MIKRIVLLAVATYLYSLTTLPPGLTNDEVDIGYEAYSLSQTARDQWGNFLPVAYFSGFGGTRLPGVIYWTVPFVQMLGLNPLAIKAAAAVAGLAVLVGFWLVAKETLGNLVANLSALILLFTPWFWGLTRTDNEATLALAFVVWGAYLALRSRRTTLFLPLSILLFVLSCYTYYSNQIFVLFFLPLLLIGEKIKGWLKLKVLIASIVLFAVFIMPLVSKTLTGGGSLTRLNQTSIVSNVATIGELNAKRGYCLTGSLPIWCRLVYNKPIVWLGEALTSYVNHFSPGFLFGNNWFFGILPAGNLFYPLLLPGLITSLFALARRQIQHGWLWLSWLLVAPLADSLTGSGHALRAFLMVPPIVVLSVAGYRYLLRLSKSHQFLPLPGLLLPRILPGLLALIFAGEIAFFLTDYYWFFPKRYSSYSHYQYKELMNYLIPRESKYDAIYLSSGSESVMQAAFYLFYSRFDPAVYQSKQGVLWHQQDDGWIWIEQIGKWHFVRDYTKLNSIPANSLVAGTENELEILRTWQNGQDLHIIKTIELLNGDVSFMIGSQKTPSVSLETNAN